jgi:hypothetical protein
MIPEQTSGALQAPASPAGARPHEGAGRATHRAVGAAIVAGGLAISVSVHPTPTGLRPIDLFAPDDQWSGEPAMAAGPTFLKATAATFSMLKLPDLVKLVEFSAQHPEVATGDLLGLMDRYGIRNVVSSFEFFASLGPMRPRVGRIPYGGGGAWGGGGGGVFMQIEGVGDALRALMILLEFLEQNPAHGPVPFEVLVNVLAALADTADSPHAMSVPPPEPGATPLAVVAENSIVEAPSSTPSPLASEPTGAADPAPADSPAVNPTEPPQAPVDLVVVESTEASVPVPTETYTPPADDPVQPSPEPTNTTPEPSNTAQPDPDPSEPESQKPDPPSSSGGGSDDGSTGGSGAGSSGGGTSGGGDSGGGSSGGGDSGGGSSGGGDSGGGSSGGGDSGGSSSGSE